MTKEEWTLNAKLTGEFFIKDECLISDTPLIDGLNKICITPEFDIKGKYTGFHLLDATFLIDNDIGSQVPANVVFENAKMIVDTITARVSLMIGRSVNIIQGMSIKHRLSVESSQYRLILGENQSAEIAPPIPLQAKILGVSINPKIQRAIRWFSHSLSSKDVIDRLIALNNSLDILACMVEDIPKRSRTCKKCGFEEVIGPSLRDRVIFYLTNISGFQVEDSMEIYESRIDLAHGRSSLSEKEIQRYREQSISLTNAVRNGIGKALSITVPTIPEPNPFDISSALLDIIYEDSKSQIKPN